MTSEHRCYNVNKQKASLAQNTQYLNSYNGDNSLLMVTANVLCLAIINT